MMLTGQQYGQNWGFCLLGHTVQGGRTSQMTIELKRCCNRADVEVFLSKSLFKARGVIHLPPTWFFII